MKQKYFGGIQLDVEMVGKSLCAGFRCSFSEHYLVKNLYLSSVFSFAFLLFLAYFINLVFYFVSEYG